MEGRRTRCLVSDSPSSARRWNSPLPTAAAACTNGGGGGGLHGRGLPLNRSKHSRFSFPRRRHLPFMPARSLPSASPSPLHRPSACAGKPASLLLLFRWPPSSLVAWPPALASKSSADTMSSSFPEIADRDGHKAPGCGLHRARDPVTPFASTSVRQVATGKGVERGLLHDL